MIFVITGTQLPFDRLVKVVNSWRLTENNNVSIVAQVGDSSFESDVMTIVQKLEPEEFNKYVENCSLIVSHAGMGSILTALKMKKPIIILPRQAKYKEHRNDHQLSTVKSFSNVPGIYIANSEYELVCFLNRMNELIAGELVESSDYQLLINNLKTILD